MKIRDRERMLEAVKRAQFEASTNYAAAARVLARSNVRTGMELISVLDEEAKPAKLGGRRDGLRAALSVIRSKEFLEQPSSSFRNEHGGTYSLSVDDPGWDFWADDDPDGFLYGLVEPVRHATHHLVEAMIPEWNAERTPVLWSLDFGELSSETVYFARNDRGYAYMALGAAEPVAKNGWEPRLSDFTVQLDRTRRALTEAIAVVAPILDAPALAGVCWQYFTEAHGLRGDGSDPRWDAVRHTSLGSSTVMS
ncbi:hypothetical protein [Leifsonia shinshuensis]